MTQGLTRALGLACAFAFACSSPRLQSRGAIGSELPDGTIRQVQDVPVRGAEVDVEVINGPNVSGELLAVENGSLWLSGFREVPLSNVHEVEVQLEPGVGGWFALGAVSTVTHGFWLVFTLPLWIATGVAAGQATESYVSGDELLRILNQYARYPQGMPKQVPRPPYPQPAPTPTAAPTPAPTQTTEGSYWDAMLKSRRTLDAGGAPEVMPLPPQPPRPPGAEAGDAGPTPGDAG